MTCPPAISAPADNCDRELIGLVESALSADGLELYFQPMVALRRTAGEPYEALLRLRTPDGEYVPSLDCLPTEGGVGLWNRIDRWILETALDAMQARVRDHPALRLFIPQTLASVGSESWSGWFRDQILQRDLLKCRPVLQFQLSDAGADRELAAECFAELNRLGIRVCLSRIGDDPAAEETIAGLPVSLVRIDSPDPDARGWKLFKARVRRFQGGDCAVIAQGVESPQTLAGVWQCGVDFVQGGFLQMPARELSFDFTEVVLG
jgi:EAL domain-containing protein (putative c-di-GMP-specific phosphodiesterase class I)